jgi:hypothetical protein
MTVQNRLDRASVRREHSLHLALQRRVGLSHRHSDPEFEGYRTIARFSDGLDRELFGTISGQRRPHERDVDRAAPHCI